MTCVNIIDHSIDTIGDTLTKSQESKSYKHKAMLCKAIYAFPNLGPNSLHIPLFILCVYIAICSFCTCNL